MSKIKILSGLPGSGKTTYARELVKDSGNAARVNRDDLRAMLFNSEWTGKREHVVVEIEKAIARVLLENNYAAVVDDTNLSAKHLALWSAVAKSVDAQLEVKPMDTSLAECIKRDAARLKPVGEAVINRMALFNGMIDFGPEPIEIFDLDGTLCDGKHRDHHVAQKPKDWKTYFSKMSEDSPVAWVIEKAYKARIEGRTIIICSGRPDTYQFETLAWLRKHGVPFDYIFARAGNDKREDSIIKKEILDHLPKSQIVKVFDDRPSVCRMWEENGLNVEWCRGRDCPEF